MSSLKKNLIALKETTSLLPALHVNLDNLDSSRKLHKLHIYKRSDNKYSMYGGSNSYFSTKLRDHTLQELLDELANMKIERISTVSENKIKKHIYVNNATINAKMSNNTLGNLKIKVIQKDQVLYKGFSGKYNSDVLKNSKYFYVTNRYNISKKYRKSRIGYIKRYKLNRTIRLLVLTPDVVKQLFKNNKNIMFAFADPKNFNKRSYIEGLNPEYIMGMKNRNKIKYSQLTRLSISHTNKNASYNICKFLKIHSIDGYYYPGDSVFHSEIMLCDAAGIFKKPIKFISNLHTNPKTSMKVLKYYGTKTERYNLPLLIKNLAARKIQNALKRRLVKR